MKLCFYPPTSQNLLLNISYCLKQHWTNFLQPLAKIVSLAQVHHFTWSLFGPVAYSKELNSLPPLFWTQISSGLWLCCPLLLLDFCIEMIAFFLSLSLPLCFSYFLLHQFLQLTIYLGQYSLHFISLIFRHII